MKLEQSISPVTRFFRGGTGEAEKLFHSFLAERLATSTGHRNQPQTEDVSHMSKYLHFGQISPTWLALESRKHSAAAATTFATFIEELLVRGELSRISSTSATTTIVTRACPRGRRQTLTEHRADPRPYLYNARPTRSRRNARSVLERRDARDAAHRLHAQLHAHVLGQKDPRTERDARRLSPLRSRSTTGISSTAATRISFANIACVFGQHDRPWGERPIFGKVRYMNAHGLERKCDIKAYISKVERLTGDFRGG